MTSIYFQLLNESELAADKGWWRLYEKSFPDSEREAPEVIFKSLTKGSGLVVRAREDDQLVGLASLQMLTAIPVIFLVYMATETARRSQGIGSQLFNYCRHAGQLKFREQGIEPLGMVWEVDKPVEVVDPAIPDLHRRRINFYQRNGAELLDCAYLQPPIDGKNIIPMHLMFFKADDSTSLTTAVIERLIAAIYFDKYHEINGIPREILTELIGKLRSDTL